MILAKLSWIDLNSSVTQAGFELMILLLQPSMWQGLQDDTKLVTDFQLWIHLWEFFQETQVSVMYS